LTTTPNKYVETPLMKQYYAVKNKYPDAVLLFRVGDFYETFGEDAIKAGLMDRQVLSSWQGSLIMLWIPIFPSLSGQVSG
jgi:hypothetical protein